MSPLEIVRRRMAAQGLSADRASSPAQVVRRLGAVQAQEFAEAKWSLAERTEGEPTDADVEDAFGRGEIIRVHALRPTWHFVAPEDLRWIQRLTGPRVRRALGYHLRQLEIDDDLLRRTDEILRATLTGGEPRTRAELGVALGEHSVEAVGPRLGLITAHAELGAIACSGPRRGRQHTYALVDEVIPPAPERDRDDSLAELARRYFTGHGPAGIADFSWWSGLTVTDCRRAVELAGSDLVEVEVDGEPWRSGPRPARVPRRTGAHLIPMYDELGVAFKKLRMVYASAPADGVMERPVLIDGTCVGSWRRTIERGAVTLRVRCLSPLEGDDHEALRTTAERFGRFLDLPVGLGLERSPG